MNRYCLILVGMFVCVGFAAAEEPSEFERLPLTAQDIASATGLDIYKYRLPMEPGTRFDVIVSVVDAPDAEPRFLSRVAFVADGNEQGVDLMLSFLPRDDTLRGVLLSQDPEVAYRIDAAGCDPAGIATNIALPLGELRGTEKVLAPLRADRSAKISDENEVCLIAILAKKQGEPTSLQNSYPRAKISVVFTDP